MIYALVETQTPDELMPKAEECLSDNARPIIIKAYTVSDEYGQLDRRVIMEGIGKLAKDVADDIGTRCEYIHVKADDFH